MRLRTPTVDILGGAFTFKGFDVIGGKYLIKISKLDSDTYTGLIRKRPFLLGGKPVNDTFREVNLTTGIMSATWHVHFLSHSRPSALVVKRSVGLRAIRE